MKISKIAASLILICLCGCIGPWSLHRTSDYIAATELKNTVVVMDNSLNSYRPFFDVFGQTVTVDKENMTAKDDGRLAVHVELKNNRSTDLHLQIQTVFKDVKGLMLPDESNWEYIIIPRLSSYLYTCTSMNKNARQYLVRVRESSR